MRNTCESISLRRTSSSSAPSNYIIHAPFLGDLSGSVGGQVATLSRPPFVTTNQQRSDRVVSSRSCARLTSYKLRCHLAKVVSSHSTRLCLLFKVGLRLEAAFHSDEKVGGCPRYTKRTISTRKDHNLIIAVKLARDEHISYFKYQNLLTFKF